jgi:hypothetical protein
MGVSAISAPVVADQYRQARARQASTAPLGRARAGAIRRDAKCWVADDAAADIAV